MTLWWPSQRSRCSRRTVSWGGQLAGQGCKLWGCEELAAAPPSHPMSCRAVGLSPSPTVCARHLSSQAVLSRSARWEGNAEVWEEGEPVNTKKDDLNKPSDSTPENRNADAELGQLPISSGESGCLPTWPDQAPWPGTQGQFLPLIASLGPSDCTLRTSKDKTVGPCERARVRSSEGRRRSRGKPREFVGL